MYMCRLPRIRQFCIAHNTPFLPLPPPPQIKETNDKKIINIIKISISIMNINNNYFYSYFIIIINMSLFFNF